MEVLDQRKPLGDDLRIATPAATWQQESDLRALDELFTMASAYQAPAAYRELLDFVGRFRFYAPFNATLIHIQKPGASFVAPPGRWLREYGRTIKPGVRPLVILQPMGPVMFVFDSSDTEGDPLPPDVEDPFCVRSGSVGREHELTLANANRDGVRITQADHGPELAGSISWTDAPDAVILFREEHEIPLRFEITLNGSISRETQYASLVHELAHLYCGHLGTPHGRWWPDRRGLSEGEREFEAESVAYMVCRRLGIDPKSDDYLRGYLNDMGEVPPISLECVMKVAGLIERMGRRRLKPRKNYEKVEWRIGDRDQDRQPEETKPN